MNERTGFSSKLGFILAAAGSAVGLGNIWRFPYLAAKYGGGTFLFVYLILAITFGFSLMIAEISMGRKTGKSAIEAFTSLNSNAKVLGWVAFLIPTIIFPYYCVIGGWVTKYMATFITGGMVEAAGDSFFTSFISATGSPLFWFLVFMALVIFVIYLGVDKGIENVSKVLMPVLVVLSIGIAIYACTIDGAFEGLIYYIKPRFSDLSIKTVLAALGQLFFSMSLAMGIMISYGSYMKKDSDVEDAVRQIEIFDTGIAFLAGLMIVPAVYAFSGGNQEALSVGPGLMFMTLPKVFNSMSAGGFIGAAFFILVFFAALTSAISVMEAVVSNFCDTFNWSRNKSIVISTVIFLLMGIPCCLGFGKLSGITFLGGMSILDFMDFISNSILMPVLALGTVIFVGFVIKPQTIIDEVESSGSFKSKKMFSFVIKYIAPICLVLILLTSILSALGIIVI